MFFNILYENIVLFERVYCIEVPLKAALMSDTSWEDGAKHHLPNNPWSKNINNQNDCQTKGPNDVYYDGWYNSKTIVLVPIYLSEESIISLC